MMVSDIEVNSAAQLLQTKNANDTGRLYSNVLLGDWPTERGLVMLGWVGVATSPKQRLQGTWGYHKDTKGSELGYLRLTFVCLSLGSIIDQ